MKARVMATVTPDFTAEAHTDWRLDIPEPRRRPVRWWLWSIAAMTLGVLIVGGVTRLTHSGLSIVEWKPLMGIVPPLSESQWQETFARYQAFPEYQKLRVGMTLAEFKFIFFWEYLHRLLARGIGIVFLVPFAYFLARGYLNRPVALRALLLFALGGMQGLMGWLMVASGLVDRPSVSHYRLAAHLTLAFIIFGWAVWLALELRARPRTSAPHAAPAQPMPRGLGVVGALLGAQIVWGAFVAGLKAGFFMNTFPLMAGRLVPPGMLNAEPAILNFVANPIAVQWTHRVLGTVLLLTAAAVVWRVHRSVVDMSVRRYGAAFLALLAAQYLLGVLTLLYTVPVPLGVAHQAMAMLLFGVWLAWLHRARELADRARPARRSPASLPLASRPA